MKKIITITALLLSVLITPLVANFTVDSGWTIAPNSNTSPSWSGYLANFSTYVNSGLEGNRSSSPSAFEVVGANVLPGNATVSSFNSWDGDASPTGTFTAETGNRIHNWFVIKGDTSSDFVSLSDIEYSLTSSDGILNSSGNFSMVNYSSAYVGVNYGTNGQFGGGDDSYSSLGQVGTDSFNAIYGIGLGVAYSEFGSGSNQQKLDNVYNYIAGSPGSNIFVNSSYDFGSALVTSNDFLNITTVPEPSSYAAFAGILSVGFIFFRRKIKTS